MYRVGHALEDVVKEVTPPPAVEKKRGRAARGDVPASVTTDNTAHVTVQQEVLCSVTFHIGKADEVKALAQADPHNFTSKKVHHCNLIPSKRRLDTDDAVSDQGQDADEQNLSLAQTTIVPHLDGPGSEGSPSDIAGPLTQAQQETLAPNADVDVTAFELFAFAHDDINRKIMLLAAAGHNDAVGEYCNLSCFLMWVCGPQGAASGYCSPAFETEQLYIC